MDDSRSRDDDNRRKTDMKEAASFLLRGGSLLSAPCAICNGVQIKYRNEIICINCGIQEPTDIDSKPPKPKHLVSNANQFHDHTSFSDFEKEIKERIAEQFKILKIASPDDLNNEKQRIELIGMYIELLDKLRKYSLQ
ncbi:MAG TPA: autoantigen p27 domain-containing protein [Nitrososphaeraceae archaeon]|jgi:uncharacterized Zn finger protein (UPF0148 family)|nr:autoantigen p27 domain-containing protein [Nitrososphaeraceae archaeon]